MEVLPDRIVRLRSLDDIVRLHATGDWHVGEAGCAEARLRDAVARIASDRRSLVILMGDLASFIAPDDRRWEPRQIAEGLEISDLASWGDALIERVCDIARPISRRVVGSVEGNHEASYSRRHHTDVARAIAQRLGVPTMGYSGLVTLRFVASDGDATLRIYATHGAGAAATPGGKLGRLIRTMQVVDADLVLMGHVHAMLSTTETRIRQDGAQIAAATKLGVVTGTYLAGYVHGASGYAERAGYSPVTLGHPMIAIHPRTGRMSVEWV